MKVKNKRLIQENQYKLAILNELLSLRNSKYLIPIS
jgi:hypothetical protein